MSIFVSRAWLAAALALSLAPLKAQTPPPPSVNGAAAAPKTPPAPTPPTPAAPARPRMGAAAQRNENVAVYLIDTNAIKEANVRVGANPTAIGEGNVEAQYFASEHGRPASETLPLRPLAASSLIHGEGSYWHQNSVFNARTFFQVGSVKPSHRNVYSGRLTGPLPASIPGFWTLNLSQRDIRGMVNGNILVPLTDERTPRTTDPVLRPIIQRFLDAYPGDLPNRPDFDPRALNTNAAQRIDGLTGASRLDLLLPRNQRLMASYSADRQRIRAFQLVAGQNPDTDLHSTRANLTWVRQISATSTATLSSGFQRNVSFLASEPNAVGPRVRFGFQIEELGPDSMFPVDRSVNTFRHGAVVSHTLAGGRHTLTWGGDITRTQLNGIESSNSRGFFQFTNNFGLTAIENLLLGRPTQYEIAIGRLDRGFRNWTTNAFIADRWKVHARLQLYIGLRYTADSTPVEIHRLDTIPYDCDCNNFSPRLSLAFNAGRGFTLRASYVTSFGQILPVTYQQVRNNPPNVLYVMVQDPDLANPLKGVRVDPNARYTPTWLSPELVAPYSHQYNLSIERRIAWGALVRTSYIGSRTIKLLNSFIQNRANPVAGIPLTTATVNLRRPDPRYYETWTVTNGGIAYFDAGQASLDLPTRHGLSASVSYTFSKALDQGQDFSGTAANQDLMRQRSQWQYESFGDRKGYSNFDSPHAFTASYTYDIPVPSSASSPLRALMRGWTLSGVHLWKKGTPLSLFIGSDAPGFGNVDGGPSDRPNIVDPTILGSTISHPSTATDILRRDRFSFIVPGEHRGNLGRGAFRKASIWNWNGSVTRQFRLPHESVVQLRAEVYNLSNTPQFDEPQRNLSSPSFGKITNTLNDGRVFQLGFRLLF